MAQNRNTNYHSGSHAMDLKERKRQQNRIAQRTYRQNQKEKLKALEEAVSRAASREAFAASASPARTSVTGTSPQLGIWDLNLDENLRVEQIVPSTMMVPQPKDILPPWNVLTPPEDTPSIKGRNALHRAAYNGNAALCALLLESGADDTKLDADGLPALQIAINGGHDKVVDLFLQKGNPSVKDVGGRTALFQAVTNLDEELVTRLLNAAIDVNAPNVFGKMVLHVAIEHNSEAIVRLLLSRGANINA